LKDNADGDSFNITIGLPVPDNGIPFGFSICIQDKNSEDEARSK
jgi:hypothetical protein